MSGSSASLNFARILLTLALVVAPALTRADIGGADGDSEIAPSVAGANVAGGFTDPVGDAICSNPTVACPDITSIDAVFDSENLYVTALSAQNTFDIDDYRFLLYIDVDQDPQTGVSRAFACSRWFNGLDLDLRSDTQPSSTFGSFGIANVFVPGVGVVGSVPIDFGDDSLSLAIPLSLIQDDGNVNFALALADSIQDGHVNNCDIAPNTGWAQSARLPEEVQIDIDIKPGNVTNSINLFGMGTVPVAVLGSGTFDVADVDATTLAFGPEGARLAHQNGPHPKDANHDGFTDLLVHFRTEETGIALGDGEACVTGETLDGLPFQGCDFVRALASP
jgi:hypothetical protein